MKELLYKGSVKDLFAVNDNVLFEYSDRYSLFDWGEMPDHLDRKGECLALMGALFFEAFSKKGIQHHYLHMADEFGKKIGLSPSPYLLVRPVPVVRPNLKNENYDYSFYKTKPQNGLVPLEVIFRFGIGKGSSLVKRAQKNPELLKQWGMDELKENVLFEEPLIDFSTKLEKGDRYVTFQEAKELAGLSDGEFNQLILETKKVAHIIREIANELKVELWDGKVEWAFMPGSERGFMLVDSVGLDELRLVKDGISLSKEFLREHYRQTSWFEKLEVAKSQSGDFKVNFQEAPKELPVEIKKKAEDLYLSFTNDLSRVITGDFLFDSKYQLQNWTEKKL